MRIRNLKMWHRAGGPAAVAPQAAPAQVPNLWVRHPIDDAFPYQIRAGIAADGTPYVQLLTTPTGDRPRPDKPHLVMSVDGTNVIAWPQSPAAETQPIRRPVVRQEAWSRHPIHAAFPHTIRATVLADGTPYLDVATITTGYRDRCDRPWLMLYVDTETVYDENPMPPQALYENRAVVIPVDRWVDRRTAGVAPDELTDQAANFMTAQGWDGNAQGAKKLAEWAEQFGGPVVTLCTAGDIRMFLDEEITVLLFPHPEHGPLAAVLYMDSGDAGDTYDLQIWHSAATAAQWSHWADFDLYCPYGHIWRYRSEQSKRPDYVTDQDGTIYEHLDLWPGETGYPAILTPIEPGSHRSAAYCPRCASECTPRMAALRD